MDKGIAVLNVSKGWDAYKDCDNAWVNHMGTLSVGWVSDEGDDVDVAQYGPGQWVSWHYIGYEENDPA